MACLMHRDTNAAAPGDSVRRSSADSTVASPELADSVQLHQLLWEVFIADLGDFAKLSDAEKESWIAWVLDGGSAREGLSAFSFRVTATVAG